MRIHKLDRESFTEAFGIRCRQIFPSEESGQTPFSALWNLVPPAGATRLHRHHEGETFIVAQGRGTMTDGEQSHEVEAGDVVFIPPFTEHSLVNGSDAEELLFLNVYWEDMKLLFAGGSAAPAESQALEAGERRRVLVFGSPPNPNGDLHLGHLAGPYLSADVYTRYRRMLGDDAYYALGTDDNQVWTAAKAEQEGVEAQELADRYAGEIHETLRRAQVEVDWFYRPNRSLHHRQLVRTMVERLWADGHLVARDAPALVCERCDRYLFEFYVTGRCPHCGKPSCGNACEECGRPNRCVDLVDPVCRTCGETPVVRDVRRLFFPLEPHRESLERYLAEVSMTTAHRSLCRTMLEAGLPEVVSSHPTPWGIPVPVEGFEGQSVSAWLEMAPGYLSGSWDLADHLGRDDGWQAFWRSGDEAEVVQFFGFDNGWNHGLLYYAVFRAYDPETRPPRAMVANQLYRLDGSKFSTSRGHAVWARDLLETASPDAVRCYLGYTAPEVEQTNFSMSEFDAFVEGELVGRWEGWLRELGRKVEAVYGGEVPEAGTWTDAHRRFLDVLKATADDAAAAYRAESFSLQRLSRVLIELVRRARDFGRAEDAWGWSAATKDERRTGVALELAAARTLALAAAPLMPGFAHRLWRALGYEGSADDLRWETEPGFVPAGQALGSLDAAWFPVAEKRVPQMV